MPTPIDVRQLDTWYTLHQRLHAVRDLLTRPSGEPDRPLSGLAGSVLKTLLADTHRLMSREPGGRHVMRLDGDTPPTATQVADALHDIALALAAFRAAHSDALDAECGEWLVLDPDQHRPAQTDLSI